MLIGLLSPRRILTFVRRGGCGTACDACYRGRDGDGGDEDDGDGVGDDGDHGGGDDGNGDGAGA
eukprot:472399-Rhodomonas_salina.1